MGNIVVMHGLRLSNKNESRANAESRTQEEEISAIARIIYIYTDLSYQKIYIYAGFPPIRKRKNYYYMYIS